MGAALKAVAMKAAEKKIKDRIMESKPMGFAGGLLKAKTDNILGEVNDLATDPSKFVMDKFRERTDPKFHVRRMLMRKGLTDEQVDEMLDKMYYTNSNESEQRNGIL